MGTPEIDNAPTQVKQAEAELRSCMAGATGWDASCEAAAKRATLAMAESGMQPREMRDRLWALGISWRGSRWLVMDAQAALRKQEEEAWQLALDKEFGDVTPVCPHCLRPVGELDLFCPHCMGPISALASIDPMGQVFSEGRLYQRAVSDSPRKVVLVGMWLIFGPTLASLVYCLSLVLRALGVWGTNVPGGSLFVESDGFWLDLLKLILTLAGIALNAAILWKMTARWFRSRRDPSPS